MYTLKNRSRQTIPLVMRAAQENSVLLKPRCQITVRELTPQMQNLIAKKVLKKITPYRRASA